MRTTTTETFRLLVLSSAFHPLMGGAERQALETAKALRSRGIPVLVATLHDPRRPGRSGFLPVPYVGIEAPKIRIFGPSLAYLRGIGVVRRLCRRPGWVCQVQSLDHFTLALALAARFLRVPLLIRISGAYEMNLGYLSGRLGLRPFLARWLLRKADLVLALNPEIEERLLALSVPPERILQLPNPVPDRFFALERVEGAARRHLDGVAVLQVGRLDRFKGGAVLVEAWKTVRQSHPEARLHLVGGGHPQERAALQAMVDGLDLASSVKIWGSRESPEGFYQEADIFVLPSLSEGMPNALLEAMAAGLACIASDLPSTRGIVEDGRSGILAPPGNPQALATAIRRLLESPDLRRELGRRARERVEPWATSKLIESYLDNYRKLARGPRKNKV